MKHTLAIALTSALLVSACATTTGLDAQTKVSSFDNTKSIGIPAHGLSCSESGIYCPTVGFQWNEKHPNDTYILVQIIDMYGANKIGGNYVAIDKLRLNIDGEILEFEPMGNGLTDYDYDNIVGKKSTQIFKVQEDLLKRIYNSQSTKVQLVTSKGLIDDFIIDNGKDTKAYHALGRFLTALNSK